MANRIAIFTNSSSNNVFYFNGDLRAFRVYLQSLSFHGETTLSIHDDYECTVPVSININTVIRYQEVGAAVAEGSTGGGTGGGTGSGGGSYIGTSVKANVITASTGGQIRLPDVTCGEVTIIAKKNNTGSIYVGGSDVSASVYGVELKANESFTFTVANANLLYIFVPTNGDGISYVAV